jgi:predicted dehydrogenase
VANKLTIGIIGCGYWGPNLIRNFSENSEAEVRYICDLSPARLAASANRFPSVTAVTDSSMLFNDPDLDAIAIATPAHTHFSLARQALAANKHVLIEKPMCLQSQDCLDLIALAEERELTLMVDHPFVYHGAVRRIKEEIATGALGDILYFDSVRINLGLFQSDINVLWDLAPHDLSIIDFLFNQSPVQVQAFGQSHTTSGLQDMAYVTLIFADKMVAHMHLSWLSPVKVRQILIGGTNKMIAYDDLETNEKVKIYDKGVSYETQISDELRYQNLVKYRIGATYSPVLDLRESLTTAVDHFIKCVSTGAKPDTDGWSGHRVVNLLEAIDRAMLSGKTQELMDTSVFERV